MPFRSVHRGLAALAATCLVVFSGGAAFADGVQAVDGDIAAMATTDISVTGCTLPVARDGLVTVKRNGNKHLTPGQPFTLVATTNPTNAAVTTVRTETTSVVPPTFDENGHDSFSFGIRTTIASGQATGTTVVSVKVAQPGYTDMVAAPFTVTWDCANNQPPAVTIGGVTNGQSYEYGSVPAATCSFTDDHDGSGGLTPVVSAVTGPRAASGLGSQTVSCSYTDQGGLSGSATATYAVVDTTPPSLTAVADVAADAVDAQGAPVSFTAPTATDAVDGARPVTCAPASGATFPLGTTTVTCSAKDVGGLTGSTTFHVTVADHTAPVVTVPKDVTVDATSPAGAAYSFTVTADDSVDGTLPASCDTSSGSTFGFGATTVTCSATDAAGNKGTASFTVTVQDSTAPVVTVHEPAPAEATGSHGAVVSWEPPTAVDDVDGARQVGCDAASGDVFPVGTTLVTCSATDAHGNKGSATFTVTVTDTTPPVVTVPGDLTREATSPNGAVVSYAAGASDLVDGTVAVSCTPASGTQFALDQHTTVTCSATDAHGNSAHADFTVSVVDTTAPALPTLTDVVEEATGPSGAVVTYAVDAASDIVDGDVGVSCTPASGRTFALGDTTVTCGATDAHDNTATGTFTVRVRDTTPPVFDPISVDTVEALGPHGAPVRFAPHATDLVDPAPSVVCDPASGSVFPLGSTQVTCTATDASRNHSELTFTVNVADTTPPIVGSVANQTVEATSAAGAPHTWVAPTATDLVDGDRTVTCDHEQGSTFPLGATVVTCSATDLSGNRGSSAFTVTVRDTTAPSFATAPNLTVTATSSTGAVVTYPTPVATDLVDGATAVTCTPASGTRFPLGTTTVGCTSRDHAGNTATTSFTVTVVVGWSGVLAPVNDGGSFKQGSTIPVKFSLTGASAPVTTLQATLWVRRLPVATGTGEAAAVSTSAATTGNLFRYTDGQYLFNLNTKPLAVGSYELRIDLGDGVQHTVTITLR